MVFKWKIETDDLHDFLTYLANRAWLKFIIVICEYRMLIALYQVFRKFTCEDQIRDSV